MPLQIGHVLRNRYRIVRLLGQGGFGAVYRAWDINLNKACAVKENLTLLPEAQRQFEREARVLANLNHTNLPRVIDHFSVTNQGQYLVMDYVEGEDLASRVELGERVRVNMAVEWISQVADALSYLHTRKPPIVHRDVKPANIRITPDGRAMLVDFGIFKFAEPSKSTTKGARAVTPGYSPPEQYGRGGTDARTDIYALAATLYALLTGQEPVESVLRIGGTPLPSVNQLNPAISPEISQAINVGMQLEPDHRYQTVMDFISSLQTADATLVMQPVSAPQTLVSMQPMNSQATALHNSLRETPTASAQVTYPPVRDLKRSKPEQKRNRTGIRILAVVLAMAVVATIIVGGLSLFSGGEENVDDNADQIEATVLAGLQATNDARGYSTETARAKTIVDQGWVQVFGPSDGGMVHDPEDGLINSVGSELNVSNFNVAVTFINPYSSEVGTWDYGFIFRHAGPNRQYRLIVRSDRNWILRNNDGQVDGEVIMSGSVQSLKINDDDSNHVRLVAEGEWGEFYVNDVRVAELDLSARMNPGDVYIVSGVLSNDEIEGYVTEFRDFSVWSAP